MNTPLFTEIKTVADNLNFNSITDERKNVLQALIDFIQAKKDNSDAIRLHFICTHNSRRSHLAQIWAKTAAFYFNIQQVYCYSGGTEATAMYPMVATTLENFGFKLNRIAEGKNPIYTVKYAENEHPIICFSKKYDDTFNPASKFGAILTCNQADTDCPFIGGAEKRISIPFLDPKEFDSSPLQKEKYKERSIQIATEMFYVFAQIK